MWFGLVLTSRQFGWVWIEKHKWWCGVDWLGWTNGGVDWFGLVLTSRQFGWVWIEEHKWWCGVDNFFPSLPLMKRNGVSWFPG
jgi:hypothetical protein